MSTRTSWSRAGAALLLCTLIGPPASAELRGGMSFSPEFAEGIDRVAIVVERCDAAINCDSGVNMIFAQLKRVEPLPFAVQPPGETRQQLMNAGVLDYESERRKEIALALGVDALFVLRVIAEREANVMTGSKSRVMLDLYLIRGDGKIVAKGGGGGLATIAATTIDRAVSETITKVLNPQQTGAKLRAEAKRKLDE